jgi:hypothetical protein
MNKIYQVLLVSEDIKQQSLIHIVEKSPKRKNKMSKWFNGNQTVYLWLDMPSFLCLPFYEQLPQINVLGDQKRHLCCFIGKIT